MLPSHRSNGPRCVQQSWPSCRHLSKSLKAAAMLLPPPECSASTARLIVLSTSVPKHLPTLPLLNLGHRSSLYSLILEASPLLTPTQYIPTLQHPHMRKRLTILRPVESENNSVLPLVQALIARKTHMSRAPSDWNCPELYELGIDPARTLVFRKT